MSSQIKCQAYFLWSVDHRSRHADLNYLFAKRLVYISDTYESY